MIRRIGGKTNGKEKFTVREMDELRKSPYVLDVTQSIVHFSAQFKTLIYEGLQAGKAPAEIILEHGIDPEILGVNRVNGLKSMVLKEARAGKGFRDLNTYGTYLEHLLTPEAKIRLLEQELAYKDQIIEYLKKLCP